MYRTARFRYNYLMFKKISETFTQGSLTTILAINFSQAFSPSVAYPVARMIALNIARRTQSPIVQAVRQNMAKVMDFKLKKNELDSLVRNVFVNQSRALYNFYHYLDRPELIKKIVRVTPKMQELVDSNGKGKRGTLMLLPHMSGFDLGGLMLASQGFKYLTLSYPNPPKGYELQNKIRNDRGEEVMPMSFESMRLARERLQAGGTVLTGIDRPHPGSGYTPIFFGTPAELPVAYIKLALKTSARVVVIAFKTLKDLTYEIDVSDEIPMVPDSDPHKELEDNASRVLKVAEQFIRFNPEAWAMFYPVWPQLETEKN